MPSPIDTFSAHVARLAPVLASVAAVVVVLLIASALGGAVVALSVAAVISEIVGLFVLARWLRLDPRRLLTGRVQGKALPMKVRRGMKTAGFVTKPTDTELQREVRRLEAKIEAARMAAAREACGIRKDLAELDRSLASRIREETSDPVMGLVLVALGVLLSACANIVGA